MYKRYIALPISFDTVDRLKFGVCKDDWPAVKAILKLGFSGPVGSFNPDARRDTVWRKLALYGYRFEDVSRITDRLSGWGVSPKLWTRVKGLGG